MQLTQEFANQGGALAMAKKWYVIQTYSGYENKVKAALQERIRQYTMEEKFGEILIPTETVQDEGRELYLRDGRRARRHVLLRPDPQRPLRRGLPR